MQAIAIVPGTNELRLVQRPEPGIGSPEEIKLKHHGQDEIKVVLEWSP